ncbi:MAG: hypothetical protein IJL39_01550 [Clostridia bacterium]|nr:hypothetical protein [Clostridia bacterium]
MTRGRIWVSPWLIVLLLVFFAVDASVYAPLVVLSAALHEAGHLFALHRLGVRVEQIRFHPFGIEITAPGLFSLPYRDELCVAAAGPIANLLCACCTVVLVFLFGDFAGALFLVVCNLALAGLNLMPVDDLDGGRILAALLLQKLDLDRAQSILEPISTITLTLILAAGLWLLYATRYNFSLAMIGCYLLARRVLKTSPSAGVFPGGKPC